MSTKHPLVKAVEVAPSNTALAAFLGLSKQTLSSMLTKAKADPKAFPTPGKHTLKIAQVLGVKPHAIRPDMYLKDWEVPQIELTESGGVKRPTKAKQAAKPDPAPKAEAKQVPFPKPKRARKPKAEPVSDQPAE